MKLKLSRTAWLVLGIGIFAIALGSLYLVYLQQQSEQEELDQSLTAAQATFLETTLIKVDLESQLTNLESELTQLQIELTQATSSLDSAKGKFPESVESIEYDEILFNIADNYNLKIIQLTASESTDQEMEGVTYSVTSFAIAMEGGVTNVLNFVNAIATGADFTIATVEQVNIGTPVPLTEAEKEAIREKFTQNLLAELAEEELTEEERQEILAALEEALPAAEKEIEEAETPSATINLVVYSYKGE